MRSEGIQQNKKSLSSTEIENLQQFVSSVFFKPIFFLFVYLCALCHITYTLHVFPAIDLITKTLIA